MYNIYWDGVVECQISCFSCGTNAGWENSIVVFWPDDDFVIHLDWCQYLCKV